MTQPTILPPWVEYPGSLPSDVSWRQENEHWALYTWLPYWGQLSEEERDELLNQCEAPKEWRDYYHKDTQAWIANQDGPGGWILRNSLTPCNVGTQHYISTGVPHHQAHLKGRILDKWHLVGMLLGLVLLGLSKYFGFFNGFVGQKSESAFKDLHMSIKALGVIYLAF